MKITAKENDANDIFADSCYHRQRVCNWVLICCVLSQCCCCSKLTFTFAQVIASTGYDKYRKPDTGAFEWLRRRGNGGIAVDPANDFVFVGDAAGRVKNWAPGKKKDFSCNDRSVVGKQRIPRSRARHDLFASAEQCFFSAFLSLCHSCRHFFHPCQFWKLAFSAFFRLWTVTLWCPDKRHAHKIAVAPHEAFRAHQRKNTGVETACADDHSPLFRQTSETKTGTRHSLSLVNVGDKQSNFPKTTVCIILVVYLESAEIYTGPKKEVGKHWCRSKWGVLRRCNQWCANGCDRSCLDALRCWVLQFRLFKTGSPNHGPRAKSGPWSHFIRTQRHFVNT